ncbi:hypothetical protein [Amycolatopsis magusensis]|uniref:hypothetical protein n=1 Tax=Amycolatopsis magusensis TaxID=882444 RepID=UPI0037B0B461
MIIWHFYDVESGRMELEQRGAVATTSGSTSDRPGWWDSGPAGRTTLFLSELDEVDEGPQRERAEKRQRLQHKLADTTRKLDNILRQAEDADPADPSTQGLRQRYDELNAERQALLEVIADLDSQDGQPVSSASSTHCRTWRSI